MKRIVYVLLFMSSIGFSQVGINTADPRGALDIESDNLGLVLPRVTSLEDVTNNNSGLAEDGTIVYDTSRNMTCFRIANAWICIANDASVAVTTTSLTLPSENSNTIKSKAKEETETDIQ